MGKKSITTFFLLSEEELKQYQKSQEIESVVVKSTVSSKHSTAATISPVESKVRKEEPSYALIELQSAQWNQK